MASPRVTSLASPRASWGGDLPAAARREWGPAVATVGGSGSGAVAASRVAAPRGGSARRDLCAVLPALRRVHDWWMRSGWTWTAAVSLLAGTYAVVDGVARAR